MLDCQQLLKRETELKEDVDSLHYTLAVSGMEVNSVACKQGFGIRSSDDHCNGCRGYFSRIILEVHPQESSPKFIRKNHP